MLTQVYIHLGVALAGVVSFLSPCVLPLVPPYLGYLSGSTIEQMTDKGGVDGRVWGRVVLASLLFVGGITTVFVTLGAGASVLGQWVQAHKGGLSILAGVTIIGFGLHFLGLLRVPLLYRQARFQARVEGASLAGAFVMGLAFAFGWTPCIGPILAAILTIAASQHTVSKGILLLAIYSMGLAVPFLLTSLGARRSLDATHGSFDGDFTPMDLAVVQSDHHLVDWTEELRAVSPPRGWLRWQAGGFVESKSIEELMDQAKNFVCRSCSTPVPLGHKFCGRCGAA